MKRVAFYTLGCKVNQYETINALQIKMEPLFQSQHYHSHFNGGMGDDAFGL